MYQLIGHTFSKSFDWSGRARRAEFWVFTAFDAVVTLATDIAVDGTPFDTLAHGQALLVALIVGAVMLIPGLSVAIRRMHDTDRTGWWIFIGLVPVIGWIWLLVLELLPGTYGDNMYGADPREEMGEGF